MGKIFNEEKFRHEVTRFMQLKYRQIDLCFFFDGSKVIVTNAYEKKMAKMPQREKQKALKSKEDYIKRCKKGVYYE